MRREKPATTCDSLHAVVNKLLTDYHRPMTGYVEIPTPNAARWIKTRTAHPAEDVRALVRVIRRTAIPDDGRAPTIAEIATLLGIAERTLDAYQQTPRRRNHNARGVPYCTMVCLQALAANPRGTAGAIFSNRATAEPAEAQT